MNVSVPERGFTSVSKATWKAIAADLRFWQLVDERVVGVNVRASGAVRLAGSCYIGRTVVGGNVLDFVEKVPGAFMALVSAVTPSAVKLVKAPSPASPAGTSTAILVKVFV